MNVVAKFIRVHGEIISVAYIVRVWTENQWNSNNQKYVITKMTLYNPRQDHTVHQWNGDIRDEIWELLQLGSDTHLDPDDKLREMVVPQ